MEKLCGFTIHEYEVLPHTMHVTGRNYIQFRIETPQFNGKTVFFEGCDFSPSPAINPNSTQAKLQLLFWFAMSKEEIDKETYNTFTPEQKKWILSRECQDAELDLLKMEEIVGDSSIEIRNPGFNNSVFILGVNGNNKGEFSRQELSDLYHAIGERIDVLPKSNAILVTYDKEEVVEQKRVYVNTPYDGDPYGDCVPFSVGSNQTIIIDEQ